MCSTARETEELVNHMELSKTGFVRLHLTTTYILSVNFLSDVQKSHRPNISQHVLNQPTTQPECSK
jgi:hypothetical protein